MSYTICYDRLFLKTGEDSFVPCWLAGDNNVTVPSPSGREKRERSWSIFHNKLNVSQQELLDAVQPFLNGYNEHWRTTNGKWCTDDMLIRWIKNGCKNAYTLEDVLKENNSRAVQCYASVWYPSTPENWWGNKHELEKWVSTTEELCEWIQSFESRKGNKDYEHIFPIIAFAAYTPVRHPQVKTADDKTYVIKYTKNLFVYAITATSVSYDKDPKKALVMTYEEYQQWRDICSILRHGTSHKLVDASVVTAPFDTVIAVAKNGRPEGYVYETVKSRLRVTADKRWGKKYRNEKAANTAIKSLEKRFTNCTFAAEKFKEE